MQYDVLQAGIDALTNRRRDLYNARRTGNDGETEEVTRITTQLQALRRSLKLCGHIESDIPKMQAVVQASKAQRKRGPSR